MANNLRKIEGFDWMYTVDYSNAGYYTSGTPTTTATSTRFSSGRMLQCSSTAGLKLDALTGTIPWDGTIGFAFKNTAHGGVASQILRIMDGSSQFGNITLKWNTDRTLSLIRADGTVIDTTSNTMSDNTWYYIELRYDIATSSKAMEIRVDGIPWKEIASTNSYQGVSFSNDFIFLGGHGNGTTYFDDFYFGGYNSGFLGDMQIVSLYPTGDESTSWGGNDGNPNDNYALVDEASDPDDDNTYVYTTGDEFLELYGFQNLGVTANQIFGIEMITRAKRSGVGSMFLGHVYQTTAGQTELASHPNLGTSYVTYKNMADENPDTQSLFTQTEIDNLRYGSRSYTGTASSHGY